MARMVSQITFRSEDLFTDRFGREVVEPIEGFELWQRFEVERYLEYHGDKLARRFDANSYLLLTKAMDLHDLGRARGGMDNAVRRISAPSLVMGVNSDFLYPTYQQETIAGALLGNGVDVRYVEIDSPHGHDGFLLEHDQVGAPLHDFLLEVEKSDD
jgi:homoserine O-acetyltransferase